LAIIGFFGTWYWVNSSSSIPTFPSGSINHASYSGLDLARGISATNPSRHLIYLELSGSIIIVIGSILALLRPKSFAKVLLGVGGILVLIGGALGLSLLETVSYNLGNASTQIGAGYGTYLVAIGGTSAILITLGLKEKNRKR
jgi:hypothetical protein